jgi:hypothetical protein
MTEPGLRARMAAGAVLAATVALTSGCAPTPVTRTVTTEQTTTTAPPPPVVTTTRVEETATPVVRQHARPRVAQARRTPVRSENVVEETTETRTIAPTVQSTTRSTTETTIPR